jgi:hypothetical protein
MGGGGTNNVPTGTPFVYAQNWPGAGGGGTGAGSGYNLGGTGLVVFAYTTNAAPVVTSNFLAFF